MFLDMSQLAVIEHVTRPTPPATGDERETLDGWLEFHRATLLRKCAGLTAAELCRRSVPPSELSLLGLVRHMTEVEHFWWRRTLRGEPASGYFWNESEPSRDFDGASATDAAADIDLFLAEVATCRTISSEAGLDGLSVSTRHGHQVSVRWIYVHLIEEYARHNGHADLLRECIDGTTGA